MLLYFKEWHCSVPEKMLLYFEECHCIVPEKCPGTKYRKENSFASDNVSVLERMLVYLNEGPYSSENVLCLRD
jgi:hypothetical protein